MARKPFLFLIMVAFFPTTIWDGDSEGRNSDDGSSSAPDWRDWEQMLFEMIAVQTFLRDLGFNVGTESLTFGPTPEASMTFVAGVIEFDLTLSGANEFRIGDGTNYFNIDSTGIVSFGGTGYLSMETKPIYFGPTPEASMTFVAGIIEFDLTLSGSNEFRIGDGTNYFNIDSTGVVSFGGTGYLDMDTKPIYFGPTPEVSLIYGASILELNLAESGTNEFRVGDGTNYVSTDSTGAMTLEGTAKRKITSRPILDAIDQMAHAKPSQVEYGVYKMYSFPIYSSDNEELFFTSRIPYAWDGASDIEVFVLVALSGAEDINDTFKMQLSWESIKEDGVLSNASHDVDVQQIILADRFAQYTEYDLRFVFDYNLHGDSDDIQPGDVIGMRLRRIASSGTEVDNEILFVDVISDVVTDKVFGTWTRS